MASPLRIALAQINLRVGDIQGNTDRILAAAATARDQHHADAVLFPELSITGYPPEDLLLRPGFRERARQALERLRQGVHGIMVVVGHPQQDSGLLYNACSAITDGRIVATYYKQELPNYGVFDEKRYFSPGEGACVLDLKGVPIALTVCEDIWMPGTAAQARNAGARLILNINASPYHINKTENRYQVLRAAIAEGGLPIVYLNLVGGQDELVFDGASLVVDGAGELCYRAPDFEEQIGVVEIDTDGGVAPRAGFIAPALSPEAEAYKALVLGVRDYVHNNRFSGAVLGLSGGIDSALTLAIACDALGPDRVEAVLMPYRYTAPMSIEDAEFEARALGVAYRIMPIERPVAAFIESLREEFAGMEPDVTEENIQARCRGVLLMAISNKMGKLVLTTGNKSEIAVGYATLYGDMAGGFAPLKDVLKTRVFRLAAYRNSIGQVIPQRVFDRPPSAELRPDQRDDDSLPPYAVLDSILERYVEHDQTPAEIVAAGFERATIERVLRMVDNNEYKRRQAAPGVRITQRAFGRDRRYPITSGYREID